MAINFPDSPNTNDEHTAGGITWKYDGTTWKSLGQGASTYSIPTASSTQLGGIKVGDTLGITSSVLDIADPGVLKPTSVAGTDIITVAVTRAAKTNKHPFHGTGSSDGYLLDGVEGATLKLIVGRTYRFDQSHSSNSGHLLQFFTRRGKLASGATNQYDTTSVATARDWSTGATAVTFVGTPGSAGAYTQLVVYERWPRIMHYESETVSEIDSGGYVINEGAIEHTLNEPIWTNSYIQTMDNISCNASLTVNDCHFYDITSHVSWRHQDYLVKVAAKASYDLWYGTGSSNNYTIAAKTDADWRYYRGAPHLIFIPGNSYEFDQSDASNSGHPLRFYEKADKTGGEYTTGVTTNGTPGTAGAYTRIDITFDTPGLLHYGCNQHSHMGGAITTNTASGSGSGGGGTTTVINNNGDNKLITGSATADNLNAESDLTFDGTKLNLSNDKKITFGNNLRMEIYTDGSENFIQLPQDGSNAFALTIKSNTTNALKVKNDGNITVAGNLTSGSLTSSGLINNGLTYPTADGSANQVLSTNGSGTLSWQTINNAGIAIDALTDVDTSTTAPQNGEVLKWNGTNWVPGTDISGGSGSGLSARATAGQATSASHANGASENITIGSVAKTYGLLKIQTSHAAWVTLYTDTTARSNDSTRNETTDPLPGNGVIAEVITNDGSLQLITPGTLGFNNDATPSDNVYAKVVNKSGATRAITVTLTFVKLEA
tara:strand:+ start:118 stop:2268 length:2151 start_codon:yes stop_codon:yes gene_type:complete